MAKAKILLHRGPSRPERTRDILERTRGILDQLGGIKKVAELTGASEKAVRAWVSYIGVPYKFWLPLLQEAERREIVLTTEQLRGTKPAQAVAATKAPRVRKAA